MASVEVTINGRLYELACDDGEEERLSRLAEYVDDRVRDLVTSVGQVGDTRLLVLTSLLIADELYESQALLDSHGVDPESGETDADAADGTATGANGAGEEALAAAIEKMAERIETIAAGLEQA